MVELVMPVHLTTRHLLGLRSAANAVVLTLERVPAKDLLEPEQWLLGRCREIVRHIVLEKDGDSD